MCAYSSMSCALLKDHGDSRSRFRRLARFFMASFSGTNVFQAPICEDAPATSTGMCPEIESRSQQQQTKPYISFVLVLQLISDGTRVFLSPAESELDTVVEP